MASWWVASLLLWRIGAVRTVVNGAGGEACTVKEALRISYHEPFEGPVGITGTMHEGQFDFIHPSAWNGVVLATKYYGERGSCVVDYSVVCSGSDATLQLTDSCGKRSDTRSLFWSRKTELHVKKSLWNSGGEVALKVYVPSQRRSIRMVHDGSRVGFRLVSPPTLEETALQLKEQLADPSQVRFFAQVPKVASCLPGDQDNLFTSMQNGSYSAQQCSACRNFLKTKVKGTETCGETQTSASLLRCKFFEKSLEKEGVLDLVVTSIAGSWQRSKSEDEATMALSWKLGCQDLGCCPLDPVVSKVLLDEANILVKQEKFAEEQRESRREDPKNVKSGVVDKILDDANARTHLENLLQTKVYMNKKGLSREDHEMLDLRHCHNDLEDLTEDLDLDKLKVATSDAECRWNFKKTRCSPRGSCAYKFRMGDTSLHQSCRLKVKPHRPTSNAECLWNWKEARCHHPQYCARRCKRDFSLDKCCKLRKVPLKPDDGVSAEGEKPSAGMLEDLDWNYFGDAVNQIEDDDDELTEGPNVDPEIGLEADEESEAPMPSSDIDSDIGLEADESEEFVSSNAGEDEEEGNCVGKDQKILSTPDFAKKIEEDVRASVGWGMPPPLKRGKCLEKHVKRGLSKECASCFVDVAECGMQKCMMVLARKDRTDPAAVECLEAGGCQPSLRKCSGLTNEQLP